jgi:hypothetical protein
MGPEKKWEANAVTIYSHQVSLQGYSFLFQVDFHVKEDDATFFGLTAYFYSWETKKFTYIQHLISKRRPAYQGLRLARRFAERYERRYGNINDNQLRALIEKHLSKEGPEPSRHFSRLAFA